jgi:hypothetical protein
VLAFAEHRFQLIGIQRGMEVRPRRTDNTVRGPRVDEIRLLGEVRARIDVPVAGADDMVVASRGARQVVADPRRDGGATGDGEAAAFAEVVLYVDDNEGTGNG